jgi:hypothetical protein
MLDRCGKTGALPEPEKEPGKAEESDPQEPISNLPVPDAHQQPGKTWNTDPRGIHSTWTN